MLTVPALSPVPEPGETPQGGHGPGSGRRPSDLGLVALVLLVVVFVLDLGILTAQGFRDVMFEDVGFEHNSLLTLKN